MPSELSNLSGSEGGRLDGLIASFLDAEDLGRAIDLELLLRDAPELREEFLAFVKEHEQLRRKHTGYTTTPPVGPPQPIPQALLQKTTQHAVRVGQVLGDCEILRELGRGGMGVVYVAQHVRLKDLRAIKILPRDQVTDVAIRRFWKEAQTAARMNHLHVINIQDVGHDQNLHYIVMQYIDGQTLQGYLDRYLVRSDGRPFPGSSALRLIVPVLDALAAMHARGLVHRDIKPSNIMVSGAVSRRQHVVVMDFGLVRDESDESQSNAIVGTPAYMAKEQALGDPVDGRCDLYAVGATLYYLLTARHPYEGKPGRVLALAAQGAPPTPLRELRPDLPDQICKIVERAMEHDLDRRYARAADMLKDITAALRDNAAAAELPADVPQAIPARPTGETASSPPNSALPAQETVAGHADSSAVDAPKLIPLYAEASAPIMNLVSPAMLSSGDHSGSIRRTQDSRPNAWSRLTEQPVTFVAAGLVSAALLAVVMAVVVMSLAGTSGEPGVSSHRTTGGSFGGTGDVAPASRTDMVYIPAGRAYLGGDSQQLRSHAQSLEAINQNPDLMEQFVSSCQEEPHQIVEVNGFWIDQYEVTNDDYAKFVAATAHRPPGYWNGKSPPAGLRDHPVTQVLHADATAYANWVGKQLPTIAQWNRAFRGDGPRMYPWGDTWEQDRANVAENATFSGGTSAIRSTPRDVSAFGVYNLVGNVDEIMRERVVKLGQNATIVKGSHCGATGSVWGAAPFQSYVVGDEVSFRQFTGFRCVISD